jgi:hypothetical protein
MSDLDPKYPDLVAKLVGEDGNAYNLLGIVGSVLRQGGVSPEEVEQFHAEATSGDYDHLLRTCCRWVTVT